MNRTMKIVHTIGQMNLEGNIIPHNWFCHLRFENGKPHVNAAILLSEVVYWYRPTIIKDEATGRVIEERKKFKADKLQRSYDSFANQFGFTKRQVKDALKYLEARGIITLEFRHIDLPNGTRLANVLYIEPVVDVLHHITYQRNTSDDRTVDPYPFNGTRDTIEGQTNTDTTTEITTETLSLREQAKRGEMTVDTELNLLAGFGRDGKAGVADPAQDGAAWLHYRDQAVQAVQTITGKFPNATQQAAISELAACLDFDLELWQKSIHSCQLSNVKPGNVACYLDTYRAGGDYAGMQRGKRNGGKHANSKQQGVSRRVPGYSIADPAGYHDQLPDDEDTQRAG